MLHKKLISWDELKESKQFLNKLHTVVCESRSKKEVRLEISFRATERTFNFF